ncbi:MAG: GxxExxY protein [Kiritimatiellia bacterium]
MDDLVYKEETYEIMGACFNVYNEMRSGFLEAVYQECLEIEFDFQQIPFHSQPRLDLTFRQKPLKNKYAADFICFDKIVIEIKAVVNLIDDHRAQLMHYLRATKYQLGLLVNFGHYPDLEYERIVNTRGRLVRRKP